MKRNHGMRNGHRTVLSVLLLAGLVVAGTMTGRLTARDATTPAPPRPSDSPAIEISYGEGITIVPVELDFGRVAKQTTAKATVRIHNGTDSAIRIVRAVSDCGCTTAAIPDHPIRPGEEVAIEVSLEMPRRANRKIAKSITFILSGDLDPITLRVYARSSEAAPSPTPPEAHPPDSSSSESELQHGS